MLFSILFFITIGGCTATEETLETEPEIPIKKKVLFNQEIDGGKNSVSVIDFFSAGNTTDVLSFFTMVFL